MKWLCNTQERAVSVWSLVLIYLGTDWSFHNRWPTGISVWSPCCGQAPHTLSVHLRILLFWNLQNANCPHVVFVMKSWITLHDRQNQLGLWRQPHQHGMNFSSTVGLLETFNSAQKSGEQRKSNGVWTMVQSQELSRCCCWSSQGVSSLLACVTQHVDPTAVGCGRDPKLCILFILLSCLLQQKIL